MRVIDLAQKDLLQIVRDRKSALFLVVMPIIFTLFFSFMFSANATQQDTRLPVAFVNQDEGSPVSISLESLLQASEAIRLLPTSSGKAADAAKSVRDGKLGALVTVPAGFGEAALGGQPARLILVVDLDSSVGQTVNSAIETGVERVLASAEAARLSASAYEQHQPFANAAARAAYLEQALAQAGKGWSDPALKVVVEQGIIKGEKSPQNSATQASPGIMVQFALYGLMMSAGVLVLERQAGALQRLLTTPIRAAEIIAGHMLAMFIVVVVQEVLLVAFGQFAMGVNYARQPLAILVILVTLGLWVSSLGLLIGARSKNNEQVIMWSLVAMFVFSAMGGAWFPLEFTSKTFAAIGHLVPTAWAMDGFQNIVQRGLGLSSVLLPAGVLLAFAVAFFALAVWRFRFE